MVDMLKTDASIHAADESVRTADAQVEEICRFIEERKGLDTVAIYIGEHCSVTDYFIISTVSSFAQLKGIYRDLRDFLPQTGFSALYSQKFIKENNWVLMDCTNVIIHLMTREIREFYDLERLWRQGKTVFHSSKSS